MKRHLGSTLLRRSAGVGTVLLSLVGVLLCVAVAGGTWAGKRKLDRVNAAVFGAADDAFELMEARLDRVTQRLDSGRQRVGAVPKLAERLRAAGADVRAESAPLLQMLDDVFEQLKTAEDALASSEAIARGVGRVSTSLAQSREANSDDESAGVNARKVAELSADVADAIARVQVMRQELVNYRESGQLAREFVAGIVDRVAELDERMASVSTRVGRFQTDVSTARRSAADLGRRVYGWITFAAVLLVLVALWFAVSQVAMMRYGWRLSRRPGRSDGLGKSPGVDATC